MMASSGVQPWTGFAAEGALDHREPESRIAAVSPANSFRQGRYDSVLGSHSRAHRWALARPAGVNNDAA